MKANELMIGDWVQVIDACTGKSIPCKITSIWENEYVALDGDIDATDLPTYLLAPTPLTTEILEKNGFKACGYEELTLDTDDFWFALQKGVDGMNAWWWEMKCAPIIPINYVHELQHAMRLCGIDYEIKEIC